MCKVGKIHEDDGGQILAIVLSCIPMGLKKENSRK